MSDKEYNDLLQEIKSVKNNFVSPYNEDEMSVLIGWPEIYEPYLKEHFEDNPNHNKIFETTTEQIQHILLEQKQRYVKIADKKPVAPEIVLRLIKNLYDNYNPEPYYIDNVIVVRRKTSYYGLDAYAFREVMAHLGYVETHKFLSDNKTYSIQFEPMVLLKEKLENHKQEFYHQIFKCSEVMPENITYKNSAYLRDDWDDETESYVLIKYISLFVIVGNSPEELNNDTLKFDRRILNKDKKAFVWESGTEHLFWRPVCKNSLISEFTEQKISKDSLENVDGRDDLVDQVYFD